MFNPNETYLSIKEAAQEPILMAGRKGPLPESTLIRWMNLGSRGARLESLTIGGRRLVSREAIYRFIAKLSGEEVPAPPAPAEDLAERSQTARHNRVRASLARKARGRVAVG